MKISWIAWLTRELGVFSTHHVVPTSTCAQKMASSGGGSGGGDALLCVGCGVHRESECFSKSQRKRAKNGEPVRCKQCIETNANEHTAPQDRGASDAR